MKNEILPFSPHSPGTGDRIVVHRTQYDGSGQAFTRVESICDGMRIGINVHIHNRIFSPWEPGYRQDLEKAIQDLDSLGELPIQVNGKQQHRILSGNRPPETGTCTIDGSFGTTYWRWVFWGGAVHVMRSHHYHPSIDCTLVHGEVWTIEDSKVVPCPGEQRRPPQGRSDEIEIVEARINEQIESGNKKQIA